MNAVLEKNTIRDRGRNEVQQQKSGKNNPAFFGPRRVSEVEAEDNGDNDKQHPFGATVCSLRALQLKVEEGRDRANKKFM